MDKSHDGTPTPPLHTPRHVHAFTESQDGGGVGSVSKLQWVNRTTAEGLGDSTPLLNTPEFALPRHRIARGDGDRGDSNYCYRKRYVHSNTRRNFLSQLHREGDGTIGTVGLDTCSPGRYSLNRGRPRKPHHGGQVPRHSFIHPPEHIVFLRPLLAGKAECCSVSTPHHPYTSRHPADGTLAISLPPSAGPLPTNSTGITLSCQLDYFQRETQIARRERKPSRKEGTTPTTH